MKAPNIFEANDFRGFLKDYYEYRRHKKPAFSYTLFSKMLGFSSRSFIQNVISGKRNLSHETIEAFRKIFPRQPVKYEHFRKMVLRDQATKPSDRKKFESQIQAERKSKTTDLKAEEYSVYSQWFFIPIFFLAYRGDFAADPKWIAEKMAFKVSPPQAGSAIELLMKLGFWQLENGRVVPKPDRFNSHAELNRLVLKAFHCKMIELARLAADFPFEERILTGSTMVLNTDQVNEIREKFFRFKQIELAEYATPAESNQNERVYQLQLALFPLTKS